MSERNSPDESGGASGVRSVSRALMLLDVVTGGLESGHEGGVSLADAARLVDLPVTTVARLLRTLEDEGAIERDAAGRYGPGVRLLALASRVKTVPLIEAAGPELEGLAKETGESAYLAVRSGDQAVYVRHVDSAQPIRHTAWIGRSWPLEGTAIGTACRAGLLPVSSRRRGTRWSPTSPWLRPRCGTAAGRRCSRPSAARGRPTASTTGSWSGCPRRSRRVRSASRSCSGADAAVPRGPSPQRTASTI
jgi:hypothetical protein